MRLFIGAQRVATAVMLPALLLAGACGTGDGAKKVVVSESVCQNARFLRMDVGEKHKIVLDNGNFSIGQTSMSFLLERFPVQIQGEVPENATINGNLTTVGINAAPGDQSSIEVIPTQAGTFTAQCGTIIGGRSTLTELKILIVE